MPIRSGLRDYSDPASPVSFSEELDSVRKGTREQYESDWTLIAAGLSESFTHGLGEVPWIVDVIQSKTADGKAATAGASLTVAKTDTTVTVTNGGAVNLYYKVRAM